MAIEVHSERPYEVTTERIEDGRELVWPIAAPTKRKALAAFKALREAPVWLVLSDHMLRSTTGTELAKKMKAIKRNVPIIVYSGTVPETLRHVDGFINKDEPTSNFLSLIREFVKRYWE